LFTPGAFGFLTLARDLLEHDLHPLGLHRLLRLVIP